MKRIYILEKIFLSLSLAFLLTACEYDDTALSDRIDQLEDRIEKLEELCRGINQDIDALQQLVTALQNKDFVTAVEAVEENGRVVGYRIVFGNSDPVVIYNGRDGVDGQNGADGENGYIPQIGIEQDADGHYYWTLDGKWMLDENGEKISAEGIDGADGQDGTDGADGQDGTDGADGADGKDGVTPQLKIGEDGYWYVSLDGGLHWEQLMPATGTPGEDGGDGTPSIFVNVEVIDGNLHILLANGSELIIPMDTSAVYHPVSSLTLIGKKSMSVLERGNPRSLQQEGELLVSVSPKSAVAGLMENYREVLRVTAQAFLFDDPLDRPVYDLPITEVVADEAVGLMKVRFDYSAIPDLVFDYAALSSREHNLSVSLVYDDGHKNLASKPLIMHPVWFGNLLRYYTEGAGLTGNILEVLGESVLHIASGSVLGLQDNNGGIIYLNPEMKVFPSGIQDESILILEMSGIDSIADGALSGFRKMQTFIALDVTLGKGVFEGCPQLSAPRLILRNTEIPERTFKNCPMLEYCQIQNFKEPIRTIGNEAFSGCTRLRSFYDRNLISGIVTFGDYAFAGCTALEGYWDLGSSVPDQIVTIGSHAFSDCTGLNFLRIASNAGFGESALENCTSLRDFHVYENCDVVYVGKNFARNTPLDKTSFLRSVTGEIASEAFAGQPGLQSIELNCRKIGSRAFYGCADLQVVNFVAEPESVDDEAFGNCPILSRILLHAQKPFPIGIDVFTKTAGLGITVDQPDWIDAYLADPNWAAYRECFYR